MTALMIVSSAMEMGSTRGALTSLQDAVEQNGLAVLHQASFR
jgi:hypothetical protein